MKIENHKLLDHQDQKHYTESKLIGREIEPKYVIMHATATASPFDRNVGAMCSEEYTACVHLLIGRNGEYHQFAPFNRAGGHCGENHWHDVYHGMDLHSIGIEMLNAGPLTSDGQGGYFKKGYLESYTIPEEDRIFEARQWWQIFPDEQVETALSIVKLLFSNYPTLKDVLGHYEINTTGLRENDPGPAFDMQRFHAQVLGLDKSTPIKMVYKTRVYSHLYKGRDVDSVKLYEGLNKNVRMGVLKEEDDWSYVHVIEYPDDNPLLAGWIQSDRITPDTDKPRHYHLPSELTIL